MMNDVTTTYMYYDWPRNLHKQQSVGYNPPGPCGLWWTAWHNPPGCAQCGGWCWWCPSPQCWTPGASRRSSGHRPASSHTSLARAPRQKYFCRQVVTFYFKIFSKYYLRSPLSGGVATTVTPLDCDWSRNGINIVLRGRAGWSETNWRCHVT